MKLNNEEIGYVKFFIHKKRYTYFEVQVEILDHLILLLEEEKSLHPTLPFSELVDRVYETCEVDLKSIQSSLKKRLQNKYNRIFILQAINPLQFKYIMFTVLAGIMLYNLQIFLHNYVGLTAFYLFFGIVNGIVLFKYSPPFDSLLGNYLTDEIAGNYGRVIWYFSSFVLIFIWNSSPILTTSGFNITCLIATMAILIKSLFINAMIKTAWVGVNECKGMEKESEILAI